MTNQQFSDQNNAQRPRPTSRQPRRTARRSAASPSVNTAKKAADTAADKATTREEKHPAHPAPEFPTLAEAPIVALNIATTGIHPTTARLVALSVVFYAADRVTEVDSYTQRLNPGEDAGPWHLHGYNPGDLAQELGFNSSNNRIREALDGRIIITHDVSYVWGFITQEFRRAQRAANRNRGRGRGHRGRNAPRTRIPAPKPDQLIDTLATTRRQEMAATDTRLRAVAELYNITAPAEVMPEVGAVASRKRAEINADDLLEADARMMAAIHQAQQNRLAENPDNGEIAIIDPTDLVADQFGLRRSSVRVDAVKAPRPLANPGTPKKKNGRYQLVAGMEFVVSPDVALNPDVLIEQGMAAGLVYSEKLNRQSSLVVCNENHELRGKAMHAHRKDIPLIRDEEFLELLDNVEAGERASENDRRRSGAARAGGTRRRSPARGRGRGKGRGGRGNGGRGGKNNSRRNNRGRGGQSNSRSNRGGRGRGRGGNGGNRGGGNGGRGGGKDNSGGNKGGGNNGDK